MAEWLRRWTRNPLGSSRTGSNPVGDAYFFFFLSSFPSSPRSPPPLPFLSYLCCSSYWLKLFSFNLQESLVAFLLCLLYTDSNFIHEGPKLCVLLCEQAWAMYATLCATQWPTVWHKLCFFIFTNLHKINYLIESTHYSFHTQRESLGEGGGGERKL